MDGIYDNRGEFVRQRWKDGRLVSSMSWVDVRNMSKKAPVEEWGHYPDVPRV